MIGNLFWLFFWIVYAVIVFLILWFWVTYSQWYKRRAFRRYHIRRVKREQKRMRKSPEFWKGYSDMEKIMRERKYKDAVRGDYKP